METGVPTILIGHWFQETWERAAGRGKLVSVTLFAGSYGVKSFGFRSSKPGIGFESHF